MRAETDAPGVKTRDTADGETPARSATSRKVVAIGSHPFGRRWSSDRTLATRLQDDHISELLAMRV
jgi:hypothetical protein